MNTQQQTSHKQSLSSKVMKGFVSAISRLIIKFNINLLDFFELIKIETVKLTYQKKKKVYETALLMGLDHRVVSDIVNNNYINSNNKGSMMEMLILQEIHKSAKHCKDQMIPKKGDLNSLAVILKKHGFSYVRSRTVIDVLVARGAIEEKGDYIKYFDSSHNKNKQSNEDFFNMISRNFNRYSSTVIFNRDEILAGGKSLYDLSVFSTQIHPDSFDEVDEKIYLMCRSFHKNIDNLLGSYETHSVGTFEEIGVSVLQFNLQRGKNNE